ncbi:TRAP transporter large permease subunit [Flagellatimonas centrodinii]|uniref:TRAP transporter large permease n=1 Tax=Flagellatimonas centrodinii TaxID=2806210 RepID=UPI001FEECB06|nr:TRAP transporter large permease subunit [Flagellatimonas centrodinii]ULQ48187.1 TRAP transporter large permease subunit [Flagellatimonas centrodinii]
MSALAIVMFLTVCGLLLVGYPVAFTLGGTALAFGLLGIALGAFGLPELLDLPSRLFGVMTNETLMAVPLFVFMGVVLERARIAEDLLESMASLLGRLRGGLLVAVVLVGMLMAASTGIVGATVVTLGLLSLPTLLRRGYEPSLATGTLAASGTLGQIIPPSIILVLLGDVLSSAYQQAQLAQGLFSTETVSVGDLFIGSLVPGLLLVLAYIGYIVVVAWRQPHRAPPVTDLPPLSLRRLVVGLSAPLILIVAVLGSIIGGIATPTEAAAVGGMGAIVLALLRGALSTALLRDSGERTAGITTMVFMIFIGASAFSMVFNAYGGDTLVHGLLHDLPGGAFGAVLVVMVLMFLLGFIIDFIEITFVVVPIVAPALLMLGVDPVWLGVMMALNLQTSFLTPPFGFALFYLRGVTPESVPTTAIYRGVVPFIAIQLALLALLAAFPSLVTGLGHWLGRM